MFLSSARAGAPQTDGYRSPSAASNVAIRRYDFSYGSRSIEEKRLFGESSSSDRANGNRWIHLRWRKVGRKERSRFPPSTFTVCVCRRSWRLLLLRPLPGAAYSSASRTMAMRKGETLVLLADAQSVQAGFALFRLALFLWPASSYGSR